MVDRPRDASDPTTFATNTMEIAAPPANPGHVDSVTDLASPSVKTSRCASREVPCGAVAEQVFTNARITVKPVTLEPDVKSVLTKVELGEVDAGVVYVTDVKAAGAKVKGVEIPADVNASTSYPIAALTKSANPRWRPRSSPTCCLGRVKAVLAAAGFSVTLTGRALDREPAVSALAAPDRLEPLGARRAEHRTGACRGRRRCAPAGTRRSSRSPSCSSPWSALVVRAPWGDVW